MGSDVSVTKTIGYRVQKLVVEEKKKRCSPRLKKIPASKRPYYGPSRNQQQPTDDTKIKKESPTSCEFPLVATELQLSLDMSGGSDGGVGGGSDVVGGGVTSYVAHSKVDIAKVKDTLRIFNKYYFQFTKEKNASKHDGKQLAKHPNSKLVVEENKKRCSPRLKKIPASKRPYYGPSRNQQQPTDDPKIKKESPTSCEFPLVATELQLSLDMSGGSDGGVGGGSDVVGGGVTSYVAHSKVDIAKVKDTLRIFNKYYFQFTKEKNASKHDGKQLAKHPNSKLVVEENKKRCSPRLKKIPASKRPYYGPSRNQQQPTDDTKIKKESPTSWEFPLVATELQLSLDMSGGSDGGVGGGSDVVGGGVTSYVAHSKVDIAKVKDTLRIFNKYYFQFTKEKNASKHDGKQLAKHPNSKKEGVGEAGGKQSKRCPDLRAISKMLECKEVLYHKKRFGHLPGIDANHEFGSRAEMVALGLHSHWLNGIDYMGQSYAKMEEFKGYTIPIAVAIVLSGLYEDDQDNSESIVYTGQGGNDLKGSIHQIEDQKMSGGNLALKNNMEQSIPVRVIRGHTNGRHKTYTYDGLYKVSEWWLANGVSGFGVYKYRLQRLDGQPKLTSNQVHYNNGRSSIAPVKSSELVCPDIAEGQEEVHIPVMNTIDDTTITEFTYTKHNQVLSNLTLPPNASGCDCNGYCSNSKYCACAQWNGGDFPYVRSQGGRLIEAKDVVFECGPECGCGPGCINRTSQRGLKYHLEIFRTSDRGWAVKTKDFIPSGAPVCEYIGELRRNNELDNVAENDYIFEIDCCHTMKGIGGRERRLGDVSASVSKELENADENEPEFCIDAGRVGNVARFINHSCEPNLFVQCVLSSNRDPRFARIVLFASDNILPMQELTYDYGYALDSVVDNNGKVRTLPCHCGTSECRKRLY